MTDPIQYLLSKFFDIPNVMPSDLRPIFIIIGINAILIFLCLFKENLLNIEGRREEKQWSNICGTLMDRMMALMPTYEQTVLSYTESMGSNWMRPNTIFRKIPLKTKEKAEWDYCIRDAGREDHEALLREQLKTLLGKSS